MISPNRSYRLTERLAAITTVGMYGLAAFQIPPGAYLGRITWGTAHAFLIVWLIARTLWYVETNTTRAREDSRAN